jgi:hypothetical protein
MSLAHDIPVEMATFFGLEGPAAVDPTIRSPPLERQGADVCSQPIDYNGVLRISVA